MNNTLHIKKAIKDKKLTNKLHQLVAYITGQCQQTGENVVQWQAEFNQICIIHIIVMGLIQGPVLELKEEITKIKLNKPTSTISSH